MKEESGYYWFGYDYEYHSFKIEADSLDQAKFEFCLSCIDFSAYANKHNPLTSRRDGCNLEVPYGYILLEDGTLEINEEVYNEHRYYERVSIHFRPNMEEQYEHIGYLTLTEFTNFHLKQNNILEDHTNMVLSDTKELTAFEGIKNLPTSMKQIQNQVITTALRIRQTRLELVLSALNNPKEEKSTQLNYMVEEQKMNMKKMDIMKMYVGIGRKTVKIRRGEVGEGRVNVYQSYRYMREDIELLTDFQAFDARHLSSFDEFIAKHYKELLPSSRCIQAFKVTKNDIHYADFAEGEAMREANRMIFLLIRDGENVYRIYSDYDLEENSLFNISLDNVQDSEGATKVWKKIYNTHTRFSNPHDILRECITVRAEYYAGKDIALENQNMLEDYDLFRVDGQLWWEGVTCPVIYDKDKVNWRTLDEMRVRSEDAYLGEVERRAKYDMYLPVDSWRWGWTLGYNKYLAYEDYNLFRKHIETSIALIEKDYRKLSALAMYLDHEYITKEDENKDNWFAKRTFNQERGLAITEEYTYREARNTDFSPLFHPITCMPQCYSAYYYDYEKELNSRYKEVDKQFKEGLGDMNWKAFNSVAILQNLLDSELFFQDVKDVDLLFGKNLVPINFIKDARELLLVDKNVEQDYTKYFLEEKDLVKGEEYWVARYTIDQIYMERGCGCSIEKGRLHKPQIVRCSYKGKDMRGLLGVYKNSKFDKESFDYVCERGDARRITLPLDECEYIVSTKTTPDQLLEVLRNRTLREDHTSYAKVIAGIRNLVMKDENAEINFPPGFIQNY